ncbi:ferritin-like protein [Streptomyces sp. NPDC001228]|uniref:ferritin-like domain-containing protein n=1 Tax=Streptomyces sp. NPDC001228 TaxID=3154381 RepID=UPI003319AB9A
MSFSPMLQDTFGTSDDVSTTGIATLEDLRRHLQWAIEVEHSTLPPYLTALYSLDPERNADAAQLIGGVFVEEMIHLALVANLLNAVGGQPRLDAPHLLPGHPRTMPHADPSIQLALLPFGQEALGMFLRLEQPAHAGDRAEGDDYETIGQFYDAVEKGLRRLCADLGEDKVFTGDPARQVAGGPFAHTAGRLSPVTDLDSALAVLEEIVEQGEGAARAEVWDGDADLFHPETKAVSHYYRFQELALGRRYRQGDTPESGPTGEAVSVDLAGVRPLRPNPRLDDHPAGSAIRTAQEAFNQTYCKMLHQLEQAFNGKPAMLGMSVGTMYAAKGQAQSLMAMQDDDGLAAGPTFDYVAPEDRV